MKQRDSELPWFYPICSPVLCEGSSASHRHWSLGLQEGILPRPRENILPARVSRRLPGQQMAHFPLSKTCGGRPEQPLPSWLTKKSGLMDHLSQTLIMNHAWGRKLRREQRDYGLRAVFLHLSCCSYFTAGCLDTEQLSCTRPHTLSFVFALMLPDDIMLSEPWSCFLGPNSMPLSGLRKTGVLSVPTLAPWPKSVSLGGVDLSSIMSHPEPEDLQGERAAWCNCGTGVVCSLFKSPFQLWRNCGVFCGVSAGRSQILFSGNLQDVWELTGQLPKNRGFRCHSWLKSWFLWALFFPISWRVVTPAYSAV
jgi:hypothetical protein